MGILAGLGWPASTERLATETVASVVWPEVVAEARRLRVAPLVYGGLQASDAGLAPPDTMEALRRATLIVGARSACLEERTASVLGAAAAADIPVLLLKGLALQNLAYPAGIVRPMDDVDVLVAPTDRVRIEGLLRNLGYRNDLRGEEDFFASDLSYSIDLHTSLVNTIRVPARGALWNEPWQEIWRRRQPVVVGGVSAQTLGPRDTVQHLAIHAVHHHGLQGELWMADLCAAWRTWPDAFTALCDGPAGVRRSLWYCLETLAVRGKDLIPAVRAALRPKHLFPGERRVLDFAAREEHASHVRYGFTLACLPRLTSKAAFAKQVIFPSDGVYTTGFADAGRPPRHTWLAHWQRTLRFLTNGRRQNRVHRPDPVDFA
jgi:hypothetical protein